MSKKYQRNNRERRKAAKVARKAANKAMYRQWAADGVNYKAKSGNGSSRARNPATKGMHVGVDNCGNIGCNRCNHSVAHT